MDQQLQVVKAAIHWAGLADHSLPHSALYLQEANAFCFAVATGKEPGIPSINVDELTRGNTLHSAPSVGCKGLFMTNAEGESSRKHDL